MFLTTLLTWLLAALSLPAQQTDGLTMTATAGFDQLHRESAAMPVVVNARNDGPLIEGEIRVTVGDSSSLVYTAPIILPTQSDKQITLFVHAPAFDRDLTVQLVDGGRVLGSASVDPLNFVPQDNLLYGVISANPGSLAYLETITSGSAGAAVAYLDLTDLPEVSVAWNALDILVLDDTDTSRLTAGQLSAMQTWIENGGQLVVTGGPGGPQTNAGVADLLPVTIIDVISIDDLSALSEYGGVPFIAPSPYVLTRGRLRDGESLIHQDDLPILAYRQMGLGGVYFLALDPKLPPLAGWPGTTPLWETVAAGRSTRPPWGYGIRDNYYATQAISSFPGLNLPSVLQLVLFLLIYTAIVGPINFLVLKRLNRRELTWITVPILVLLFSGLTYFTSFRTRGETSMLVNMTAAYGSIEAERINTETAMGLYSPRRDRYDLNLPYDSTAFPLSTNFGAFMGGGNLQAIERSGELVLREVRTDTGEVASYLAQAHLSQPGMTAAASLSDDGQFVDIVIGNNAATLFEDAVLIYGEQQLALGDLLPGEEHSQRLMISAATTTTVPSVDPMFAAGTIVPNPLVNDPSYILGSANYFNDPELYPRWQLVMSTYYNAGSGQTLPDPTKAITLAGWMEGSPLPVAINSPDSEVMETTLYLLEIPVR